MSVTKAIAENPIKDGAAVSADGLFVVSLYRGEVQTNPSNYPTGAEFVTSKDLNGVAIGTIATVWTPASGKRITFIGGDISVSGESSVLFEDNAASSSIKYRTPVIPAKQPYVFEVPNGGMSLSAINNVLKATAASGVSITGTIWGREE